jgi:MYXO-CTERM domain-containing protein
MRRTLVLALLVSTRARGFGAGVFGYSGLTKGMNCNNCHSGGMPPRSVTISGPATVQTGTQATYTLDVVTGASSGICVGMDIGTSDGMLGIPAGQANGPYVYLNSGEITHNQNWSRLTGQTVQLSFTLTAPAAAELVTLHAWALSSDCSDDESGDSGAGVKLDVTVVEPAMPPPDFAGTNADLSGIDFAAPELPDLASGGVDAISSATMAQPQPPGPDLGPPKNEPTWACNCRMGGAHGLAPLGALLFVLALLTIRRARRP